MYVYFNYKQCMLIINIYLQHDDTVNDNKQLLFSHVAPTTRKKEKKKK